MVSWAIDKGVMAYVTDHAANIGQHLKAHSKKARQNGGRRKNKAVIQKKIAVDKAFATPLSWHGGRSYRLAFSLKKKTPSMSPLDCTVC